MKKYAIEIEVTDPDITEKKLLWLLEEAGNATIKLIGATDATNTD